MKISSILICLLISIVCKAQLPPGQYTTTNKRAIASFQEGLQLFNSHNDEKAKEALLKAIEKAPEFIEPHLVLAEILYTNRQTQQAIEEYKKAIAINPRFSLDNFYNLAQLEVSVGTPSTTNISQQLLRTIKPFCLPVILETWKEVHRKIFYIAKK